MSDHRNDLIPDEAVEAVTAVLIERGVVCDSSVIARAVLTAAAPLIAAQATKDDPRTVAHIECDCVPNLGPSHCHLCSERAGREMPWTEAHPLRAGIEALRDEIAAASPRYAVVVDRLDALLRERAR